MTTMLKVHEARATVARVTPIKGGSFEEQIHSLMQGIAAGLGDEYAGTTTKVGFVPRSKKGDGVLRVEGGSTRVVLEMTDSVRTGWGDYFDEAERNRAALAALGIVRTPGQNGNQIIRVLGTRRVVLSFDPDEDDPELLRTVVMLLRTMAIAAAVRTGTAEIATAEEKIAEALVHLDTIDEVKRLAGVVQKSATKIDSECTAFSTAIHRLLDQALVALRGTTDAAPTRAAGGDVEPGAAWRRPRGRGRAGGPGGEQRECGPLQPRSVAETPAAGRPIRASRAGEPAAAQPLGAGRLPVQHQVALPPDVLADRSSIRAGSSPAASRTSIDAVAAAGSPCGRPG